MWEPQGIDLAGLDGTRQLWEFPFSPGLHQALRERGFSTATRQQAAVIGMALAGDSFLLDKPGRNSQLLAYCIALAELEEGSGDLTVVLAHSRHAMDFIAKEYASLAKYGEHRFLVFRERTDDELLSKADIVVAGRDSVPRLLEGLGEQKISRLCICDAEKLPPGALLGRLAPGAQVFGASSGTEHLEPLMALDLQLFTMSAKAGSEVALEAFTVEDKADAVRRMSLLAHPAPFAVACGSEEQRSQLLSALLDAGVAAEPWAPQNHRRQREATLQGIQKGRVQAVLVLDTDWDFHDISVLVGLHPIDPADVAGGYRQLRLLCTPGEWEEASGWLVERDLEPVPLPGLDAAKGRRLEKTVGRLRRDRSLLGTDEYSELVDKLATLPDGRELLAAALHGYEQGAAQRQKQQLDGVRRLESKDSAPRRGRQNRRR